MLSVKITHSYLTEKVTSEIIKSNVHNFSHVVMIGSSLKGRGYGSHLHQLICSVGLRCSAWFGIWKFLPGW